MKTEPFVIERTYHAPVEKVWKALTNKEQMKQWYFDIADFAPVAGQEFSFSAGDENTSYLHLCKVTEVVPGKKLAYSWRYDGYEGDSLVTFELVAEGDTTRLKLTHSGLESFPAGNKAFSKESFAEGWSHITGRSLPAFLEKQL